VRLVALQDRAEADRLLEPLDEQTRMASWHLVTADGGVHSAGRGLVPLLRLLPGGRLPAGAVRAAQPLADAAYDFIAAHRSALGRLVLVRVRPRRRR
jgi:predicted DCC family thiol-disulfide oxidoreductase YuxK